MSNGLCHPTKHILSYTAQMSVRWRTDQEWKPAVFSAQAAFYFIKRRWTALPRHCRIPFGGGFDSFDMDYLKLNAEFSSHASQGLALHQGENKLKGLMGSDRRFTDWPSLASRGSTTHFGC